MKQHSQRIHLLLKTKVLFQKKVLLQKQKKVLLTEAEESVAPEECVVQEDTAIEQITATSDGNSEHEMNIDEFDSTVVDQNIDFSTASGDDNTEQPSVSENTPGKFVRSRVEESETSSNEENQAGLFVRAPQSSQSSEQGGPSSAQLEQDVQSSSSSEQAVSSGSEVTGFDNAQVQGYPLGLLQATNRANSTPSQQVPGRWTNRLMTKAEATTLMRRKTRKMSQDEQSQQDVSRARLLALGNANSTNHRFILPHNVTEETK